MDRKTTAIIAVVAVLAVLLIGLGIKKVKQTILPVPAGSDAILTPWGYVALSEVEGKDLECIGKYDDLIRVYYNEETYDDELDITIGYYKEGDVFEKAKSYFTQKLEECGYEQISKTQSSFSVPGLKVVKYQSYEYTKNDEEDVEIQLGVVEYKGKTYTLIEIIYSKYSLTEENEAQASENNQPTTPKPVDKIPEDIQPYDEEMKEILNSVFGEVTLTSFGKADFGVNIINLYYAVPRALETTDMNAIANEMSARGYTVLGTEVTSDNMEGAFTLAEEGKVVTIRGVPGEIELEVTITISAQNQ